MQQYGIMRLHTLIKATGGTCHGNRSYPLGPVR